MKPLRLFLISAVITSSAYGLIACYSGGIGSPAYFYLPPYDRGQCYLDSRNNTGVWQACTLALVNLPYGFTFDSHPTVSVYALNPTFSGIAVDASSNTYFGASSYDMYANEVGKSLNLIAKIAADGRLSIMDTTGTPINQVAGLVVDKQGNLYVSQDSSAPILKVTPTGVVSKFSGAGTKGTRDGTADAAQFTNPKAMALDQLGNILVADGPLIRKIDATGSVVTIAGTATLPAGYNAYTSPYTLSNGSGDPRLTGPALSVYFGSITDLAVDSSNNIYVASPTFFNQGSNTDRYKFGFSIDKIDASTANVTNFYNQPLYWPYINNSINNLGINQYGDYTVSSHTYLSQYALAVDASNNVYVTAYQYSQVRKIDPRGQDATLGNPPPNFAPEVGVPLPVNTSLNQASFVFPAGICIDRSGNIYVADLAGRVIRKLTPPQ